MKKQAKDLKLGDRLVSRNPRWDRSQVVKAPRFNEQGKVTFMLRKPGGVTAHPTIAPETEYEVYEND